MPLALPRILFGGTAGSLKCCDLRPTGLLWIDLVLGLERALHIDSELAFFSHQIA